MTTQIPTRDDGDKGNLQLEAQLRSGQYVDVLCSDSGKDLISSFVENLPERTEDHDGAPAGATSTTTTITSTRDKWAVGLAAFNAFLQLNVTGPVLDHVNRVEAVFGLASGSLKGLRKACFKALDVDGVSVYQHIPSIELFCLARWLFSNGFTKEEEEEEGKGVRRDGESLKWLVLRVNVWHYKLLTQPSLGAGSIFTKSAQCSDVPTLEGVIESGLETVEQQVPDEWRARFLVEKANVCILLGQDAKAREALKQATEASGFVYALSGALAKRTKFQEKSTSQLVVLAKSAGGESALGEEGVQQPEVLKLNDDTLLESLEFSKETTAKDEAKDAILPAPLRDLEPDKQPQLAPLDQIILLSEATLKDAFSPADTLTSEEVLPFAVRVVADKSTNWQIYTQALLVRSRIEIHRSRTVERGVLQMQAVVDQVIVDTTAEPEVQTEPETSETGVPEIRITIDGDNENATKVSEKPTSFFPVAKPAETAPAHVRLQYIHALSSPPRWHLESELAYSWAGVGSLVSALEIFKRLRLWAEVALCLAANAANNDEDGRGSGGEAKAKALLRWRLFHRTGLSGEQLAADDVDEDADISELNEADFQGPERNPPQPNAPRLFCILGDIENDPALFERAWEISKHRYSRAQRALAEFYLKKGEIVSARDAYVKAIAVNRLSNEMWSRLGDIHLRLGDFSEAADAFGRAIAVSNNIVGGDDARTWSNLGSALYSLYVERVKELKKEREEKGEDAKQVVADDEDVDGEEDSVAQPQRLPPRRDPATLLSQSLEAYKRGAGLAHDNWRIWDNVVTLGSRLRPPAVQDIMLALQNIIKIRKTEDALDIDVLRLILNEAVLAKSKPDSSEKGVYDPPRGSIERAVCQLLETEVVPLITARSELWEVITRERVWRRDFAGAIDATEKAWRAEVGVAGVGLVVSAATPGSEEKKKKNWLEDKGAWELVVERTDELVSVLENYGEEVEEIGKKWKGKARSAIRSVLGKAKEAWEGSEGWERLQSLMAGLR
ncbi:hypothetical protein B0T22DRAFT_460493 [Podospora appendiculata]|uniref:TPR repeat-containing protein n=1 Tax=Podospora appendiculata TaxID=314037 RepID=A0AAE0XA57_9PEZI|nr:hypothetical protein B0T22DRAFT_460493 [Podospora appendiculata]